MLHESGDLELWIRPSLYAYFEARRFGTADLAEWLKLCILTSVPALAKHDAEAPVACPCRSLFVSSKESDISWNLHIKRLASELGQDMDYLRSLYHDMASIREEIRQEDTLERQHGRRLPAKDSAGHYDNGATFVLLIADLLHYLSVLQSIERCDHVFAPVETTDVSLE